MGSTQSLVEHLSAAPPLLQGSKKAEVLRGPTMTVTRARPRALGSRPSLPVCSSHRGPRWFQGKPSLLHVCPMSLSPEPGRHTPWHRCAPCSVRGHNLNLHPSHGLHPSSVTPVFPRVLTVSPQEDERGVHWLCPHRDSPVPGPPPASAE